MKILTLIWALVILLALETKAQFASVTPLSSINTTSDTKNKPQSKVWKYGDKFWTVIVNEDGTNLFRLDNGTWNSVLKIAPSTYGRADCKVVGNVTHILLYRGVSSHLWSIEYVSATGNYQPWSVRPGMAGITLDYKVEAASLEADATGRMWIASDAENNINVRWSDSPYINWSTPVTLATGVSIDDLCGIKAIPALGKIGVFWTNQKTRRYGFRTHNAGDAPANWSPDEIPASQSALNMGLGMADDHLNMAVSSNGTLYCAIKTAYENIYHPKIGLLIRRPEGTWDNLYDVDHLGTRPIVLLNEPMDRLKIVYTSSEKGGDILYKESSLNNIEFGAQNILISGTYNFASSTKESYSSETVILASANGNVESVLAIDKPRPIPLSDPFQRDFWAYPNPMATKSTIYFYLPTGGEYTLALYDIKGCLIKVLGNGFALPGVQNNFQLQAKELKNSMYFLKLQTKHSIKTLKLVVDG